MAIQETINKFEGIVPGMTVRVHQEITETNPKGEEKKRIQVFEGIVLKRSGKTKAESTVTVRKVSNGVGVERIYPVHLPAIAKVEPVKKIRVRRAVLDYLKTSKKKLKETKIVSPEAK